MNKHSIFGVNYSECDYESATEVIMENARVRKSFGVDALAVHGLIECVRNKDLMNLVNKIDLIVPDGMPTRWAMNYFYKTKLKDRCYGPTLTLHVLREMNKENLSVYLYGSKAETLQKLSAFINKTFPNVKIAGIHVDRFRDATPEEDIEDINKINASGAHVVLVGRGCPRQEKWVGSHLGKVNSVMMAVGAAFDFHAGTLKQAPAWIQNNGLEWLFRLCMEPRRLWKRYLVTNSWFIYLFIKKSLKLG